MGLRIFSSPRNGLRFRRATDVLLLVASLVVLAGLVLAYPPGPLERSLVTLLASIPSWLTPLASFFFDLLALAAVLALATTLLARRWFVLAHTLASLILSVLVALGAAWLALGHRLALEHVLDSGTRTLCCSKEPGARSSSTSTTRTCSSSTTPTASAARPYRSDRGQRTLVILAAMVLLLATNAVPR